MTKARGAGMRVIAVEWFMSQVMFKRPMQRAALTPAGGGQDGHAEVR